MPLKEPPVRSKLRSIPTTKLPSMLYRVHRAENSMWWFSSSMDWRFDLPFPNGSCYLSTEPAGAIAEAVLQHQTDAVVPIATLRSRSISVVNVPDDAPPAADLTSRKALAAGVTTALWSTNDRALTQKWAFELHSSGFQAIQTGAQHDPSGKAKSITLFDRAGAHDPWGHQASRPKAESLASESVVRLIAQFGVVVDHTEKPVAWGEVIED